MTQINHGLAGKENPRGHIKVISFDAEGTLVTPDFTHAVWHEAIPAFYARRNGIELAQAKKIVAMEYDKIGDQRVEWYDINYWFRYLHLEDSESVIKSCQDKVCYYPEVIEVLSSLSSQYKLTVASGTPVELLHYLLQDVEYYFAHIFSASSHYKQLKTPDFYLQVCQEMDVEPEEIAHVGDSWQFDFLNSRQIGINAFYLDRIGHDHGESLADLTQLKSCLPT